MSNSQINAVILAGGSGGRLWHVFRPNHGGELRLLTQKLGVQDVLDNPKTKLKYSEDKE